MFSVSSGIYYIKLLKFKFMNAYLQHLSLRLVARFGDPIWYKLIQHEKQCHIISYPHVVKNLIIGSVGVLSVIYFIKHQKIPYNRPMHDRATPGWVLALVMPNTLSYAEYAKPNNSSRFPQL